MCNMQRGRGDHRGGGATLEGKVRTRGWAICVICRWEGRG